MSLSGGRKSFVIRIRARKSNVSQAEPQRRPGEGGIPLVDLEDFKAFEF
jgi:hypothetical protein